MNTSDTKKRSLIDLNNARFDVQRRKMETSERAGHCAFCPEHLMKYHEGSVERESQHWVLTPNAWPYKHTKIHYLAILKRHAENLFDLLPEEAADLFALLAKVQTEENIPGGAVTIRFGDTKHSAGTIKHLHAHFLVPDLADPEYQPIRFKIGADRK